MGLIIFLLRLESTILIQLGLPEASMLQSALKVGSVKAKGKTARLIGNCAKGATCKSQGVKPLVEGQNLVPALKARNG